MNTILRNSLRTSSILFLFAIIGTAMLAYTFRKTEPVIEASKKAEKLALINQVLPADLYDNNLFDTYRELPAHDLLGTRKPSGMWLATRDGQAVGIVLEAIAPEGYNGNIDLLIGISTEGQVTGVRVAQHKETPGLGDYIESAKSPWILQFAGKSHSESTDRLWKVRKDGGEFDSRAGATITPRAIVKAVREALKYFQLHREALLQPPKEPPKS